MKDLLHIFKSLFLYSSLKLSFKKYEMYPDKNIRLGVCEMEYINLYIHTYMNIYISI